MTLCVVSSKVLDEMTNPNVESGSIWGILRDDGDIMQVFSTKQQPGTQRLGLWIKSNAVPTQSSQENAVTLQIDSHPSGVSEVRAFRGGVEMQTQIADYSSVFERIEGVLKMEVVRDRKVLVAGVGSGGSRVALELAEAGVSRIVLVDKDRLEMENVVRHICGISDVGRFKTRAVRDVLLEHNPNMEVSCHEFDIATDLERYCSLVGECDLVIAATGSPKLNSITNSMCIKAHKPAVFGGVWERGSGGFVMRYIPDKTPCYDCVHGTIQELAPKPSNPIDYSTLTDLNELKSEPGLGIDVGFISLLQSKMAILAMMGDNVTSDIPQHLVIWLNRAEGKYAPLTLLKASAKRRDDCLSCGEQLEARSAVLQ